MNVEEISEKMKTVDFVFSGELPENLNYLDYFSCDLIEITDKQKKELTMIIKKHGDVNKLYEDWRSRFLFENNLISK